MTDLDSSLEEAFNYVEGREVLFEVGRVVPAEVDCGCGFNDYVDAETGKEVIGEQGTVEMQVSYNCPDCGEEFEEVYDCRDEPALDPRKLPGYNQ